MSTAKAPTRKASRRSDVTGRAATKTDKARLQEMFERQVCEALWVPSDLSRDEICERMETAVAAVRSLRPRGLIEDMLAVQIVATHNAALDCFRRAALPGQSPHVWEMSLRQADRLMATCLRQLETFARLRGKDTTGVMLGNFLNIQPGGQAVVRMHTALPTEESAAPAEASALALEYHPVEPLDLRRSSAPEAPDGCIKPSPAPSDERISRRV